MRKPITQPRAECVGGGVRLTWFKTTPFFQDEHEGEFAAIPF